jgi:hypothetical protein
MLKIIVSITLALPFITTLIGSRAPEFSPQIFPDYSNNNCVSCHSRITAPVALSNRYFEWYASAHNRRGVGCEKCHGGDAAITDKDKAHTGVQSKANPQSRIHWKNLPENCNACHQAVVSAFVTSRHYQQLKGSGLGPSCTACHEHMVSQVAQTPLQAAKLCAQCHATINGLMPMRLEIPDKAEAFMHSLNRANVAVVWAESLFTLAENRKMELRMERMRLNSARSTLREAKVNWHTFDPDFSRQRADEAFTMALKLKDELQKKLGSPAQ